MWVKRHGVWVNDDFISQPKTSDQPDYIGKPKIADRPHWITIVLGFISPAVAVAALIISFRSLDMSKETLKVGQAAYLSIREGRLSAYNRGEQAMASVIPVPLAEVRYSFVVQNLGNTPARITDIRLRLLQPWGWQPAEWFQKLTHDRLVSSSPADIGPKSTVIQSGSIPVKFPATDVHRIFPSLSPHNSPSRIDDVSMRVELQGRLEYTDIFKQQKDLSWCWTSKSYDNPGEYADNCAPL
jgi:hypothetical protein